MTWNNVELGIKRPTHAENNILTATCTIPDFVDLSKKVKSVAMRNSAHNVKTLSISQNHKAVPHVQHDLGGIIRGPEPCVCSQLPLQSSPLLPDKVPFTAEPGNIFPRPFFLESFSAVCLLLGGQRNHPTLDQSHVLLQTS